jgi:hypothetical protein
MTFIKTMKTATLLAAIAYSFLAIVFLTLAIGQKSEILHFDIQIFFMFPYPFLIFFFWNFYKRLPK